MQNHVGKSRIAMVLMGLPILPFPINFNVTRARLLLADLDDGAAKIWPGLMIPKPRMEHAQGPAIDRLQLIALEPLMVPDRLQQAFRRMGAAAFAQKEARFILRAPFRIKTWTETGHVQRFSGGPPPKSRRDSFPFGPLKPAYGCVSYSRFAGTTQKSQHGCDNCRGRTIFSLDKTYSWPDCSICLIRSRASHDSACCGECWSSCPCSLAAERRNVICLP